MKVIDPGHVYELNWLDGAPITLELQDPTGGVISSAKPNRLTFVKREGPGYPGNVGHHPGTNMQEVLRALIDRVKYLNNQIPHESNESTILHLRDAIYFLESRAAERHGRLGQFKRLLAHVDEIELMPTCAKCGHVGCEGGCH